MKLGMQVIGVVMVMVLMFTMCQASQMQSTIENRINQISDKDQNIIRQLIDTNRLQQFIQIIKQPQNISIQQQQQQQQQHQQQQQQQQQQGLENGPFLRFSEQKDNTKIQEDQFLDNLMDQHHQESYNGSDEIIEQQSKYPHLYDQKYLKGKKTNDGEKQMVQNLEGFPAYEINKQSVLPLNMTSRPQIPEIEPSQLSSFQSRIQKIANNIEIAQKMRFMEVEMDSENKQKMEVGMKSQLKQFKYNVLGFVSAWASSVFYYRFLWWTWSYPASNAIRHSGYWASAGWHKDDEIITWQGNFQRSFRISHIWIVWAMAPREYQLQTTEDGKNWVIQKDWSDISKGRSYWWFKQLFPWFIWGRMSFAMVIDFDAPLFVRAVRICSRKAQYNYVAIYRVEVWTKEWLIMLINSLTKNDENEVCLQLLSNQINPGQDIISVETIEALAVLDRRELFVLTHTMLLQVYNDRNMCLTIDKNGSKISKVSKLVIQDCQNLREQQWIVYSSLEIKSNLDPEWCINQDTQIKLSDMRALDYRCSSTAPDDQHTLANVLIENEENDFMTTYNEEQVFIEFVFQAFQMDSITIHWDKVPEYYVVKSLIDGVWGTVQIFKGDKSKQKTVELGLESIQGFRILMLQFNKDEFVEINGFKQYVYKIHYITIQTGAHKVGLNKCRDSQQHKWFIEDTYFIYNTNVKAIMHSAKMELNIKSNELMQLLNSAIKLPKVIAKQLSVANSISGSIDDINKGLETIDVGIAQVNDWINEVESLMKQGGGGGGDGGTSFEGIHSSKPAKNCHNIKEKQSFKKSGFYWIKPECSEQPIRVFCDFDVSRYGIAYAYYGGIKKDQRIQTTVKNIFDLRMICAKLGLEVVELKGGPQFKTIKSYLDTIGVQLNSPHVIPMMYDYSCAKEPKCKGKFNSLNREDSKEVGNILESNLIPIFKLAKNVNMGGFGLSKEGKLMKFNLGKKFQIKGMVCSTNYDPANTIHYEPLECQDVLKNNDKFVYDQPNNNFYVLCPKNCGKGIDNIVYGNFIYDIKSSICRSAMHIGAINDEGGKTLISTVAVKETVQGSDLNGIVSQDFQVESKREIGFSITKLESDCPLAVVSKDMKSRGLKISSFIQNQQEVVYRYNSSFLQESLQIYNKQDDNKQDEKKDDKKDEKKDEKNDDEEEDKKDKEVFTADIFEKIKTRLDGMKFFLRRIIRMIADSSALNQRINEQTAPLLEGNLQDTKLLKRMDDAALHMKGTFEGIQEQMQRLKKFVKKKQEESNYYYFKRLYYRQFEPTRLGKEQYKEDLHRIFEKIDFDQSDNKPSLWEVQKLTKNNKVHKEALVQVSGIKQNGKAFANVLLFRYKNYYDGQIKMSVFCGDKGTWGVIFRSMDFMNYYAFIADKKEKLKKVIRVENGKETLVAESKDGGYLENVWYRIYIRYRLGEIVIRMQEEPLDQKFRFDQEETMKVVLEAYDTGFSSGSIGIGINNLMNFYVDDFQAKAINCLKINLDDPIQYYNQQCQSYKEQFNADIDDIYQKKEDKFSMVGTKWKYKKFREFKKVLFQDSLYEVAGGKVKPAWFVYKGPKYCNVGVLLVEFVALNLGSISIGFHFQNYQNHFSVQIMPDKVNKCNLIRKVFNSERIVKKNEEGSKCGYTVDKLYRAKIEMTQTECIYYQVDSETNDYIEIFRTEYEDEYPNTAFALGIYKTRVAFTRIQFMPIPYYSQILPFEDLGKEDEAEKSLRELSLGGGGFDSGDIDFSAVSAPINLKPVPKLGCQYLKTDKQKEQYCKNHFVSDIFAIRDCQANFCVRCCQFQFIDKQERIMCMKQCGGNEAVTVDNRWLSCIQPPDPSRSVLEYCKKAFLDEVTMISCQRDLCQLCCVTINSQYGTSYGLESLRECRMHCLDKFRKPVQSYF